MVFMYLYTLLEFVKSMKRRAFFEVVIGVTNFMFWTSV